MRAGKTYLEEVAGEGVNRRLLAATVVPAVLPRCQAATVSRKATSSASSVMTFPSSNLA